MPIALGEPPQGLGGQLVLRIPERLYRRQGEERFGQTNPRRLENEAPSLVVRQRDRDRVAAASRRPSERDPGAFGRRDWVANGILFAGYHLHVPWVIPATLLDTFIIAYPAKRYRSAWIGIVVHSARSVFFAILVLTYVA